MNFPLKYFENHLPEQWLIQGEELFESGAVGLVTELERNLWVARVGENEVEIQLSPSKVKGATCDCPVFKAEKCCAHIGAALFSLRNRTRQLAEAREPVRKEPQVRKPDFFKLLQQVPQEDLVNFVRDYARQNRLFSLALKARFTGSLPIENRREQYLELLDSAVNGMRSKNDQVSAKGAQQLGQVVRELLSQAREALSNEYPQELAVLLTSILEKTGPVVRKTGGKDTKLQDALIEAFTLFRQIVVLKPAPELLQNIWEFCLRESRKFIFRQSPIQMEYLYLAASLAPALGKTEELLAHLRSSDAGMDRADPNRPELLILIYRQLILLGDANRTQEHLLENLDEPVFVLYAVEEAIATGHWKKARFLAEKGLENAQHQSVQAGKLEEHLFHLALKEQDSEAILQFGASRFLQSKKPQYLEHIKKFAREDWPKIADELLEKLESQPYSLLKRDAIARLLFEEDRFDVLSQYLLRLQSLDLLIQYGPLWPDGRSEQVESLYEEILHGYLINHLGRKPSQRVREALEGLFESGRNEIAERLLARFRTEFAARQSLMEELETFPI